MNFRPYIARPIRFAGTLDESGYRLKHYAIVYGSRDFRADDFADGLHYVCAALPQPAVNAQRPGVGFVISHQGNGVDYVVLGWWDNENELPLKVAVRPQVPGGVWRGARDGESVCVWDLEVIWFERNAYIRTMLSSGTAEDYLEVHFG